MNKMKVFQNVFWLSFSAPAGRCVSEFCHPGRQVHRSQCGGMYGYCSGFNTSSVIALTNLSIHDML